MVKEIILASKSGVRKKILEVNNIKCKIEPSNVDEDSIKESLLKEKATPTIISKNLAELKANKISQKFIEEMVLGADSVIDLEGEIISKPKDRAEATQILQSLSNDTHQVITAVGFLQKNKWECIHEISEVTFGFLSDEAIQSYVKSGSPMDKAGAYGIQDSFGVQNILSISGSYTNIIGLPVAQVLEKLKEIIGEVNDGNWGEYSQFFNNDIELFIKVITRYDFTNIR